MKKTLYIIATVLALLAGACWGIYEVAFSEDAPTVDSTLVVAPVVDSVAVDSVVVDSLAVDTLVVDTTVVK